MIYGHQCEPGWSTRRFCVSMTLATALGAGLGLLFAPQRGSDTRHSLGAAVTRLRARIATGLGAGRRRAPAANIGGFPARGIGE